ncbi:MAG: hypothetical protein AAB965_03915, partial [Patescibacteria group bacterium]
MKYKSSSAVLVLAVFLLAIIFISNSRAEATPVVKYLSGYAWSSNIGWISFSGLSPRYAVSVSPYDPTGPSYLSGYAWSSNIGWISFGCGQPSILGDATSPKICSEPEATGGLSLVYPSGGSVSSGPVLGVDNKLRGWARACSVFETGCYGPLKSQLIRGGWDGWISLSGMTDPMNGSAPEAYGVVFNPAVTPKTFSSFAWGGGYDSDGLGGNISPQFPGWIKFDGVTMVDAIVGAQTASCVNSSGVINVGGTATWVASITPGDALTHTYAWSVGGGTLVSGQGTSILTVSYSTSGSVVTPSVTIDSATSPLFADCGGVVTIGPKDFTSYPNGSMSARFVRSINSTTVPTTVSVSVGWPAGQTVPYGHHVTLSFDRIERNSDGVVKASGVAGGADL